MSSPLCGAPPRPPAFNCTLCHSATRASTTLPLQEAVLSSAGPSLATPPAPCLQSFHSGLRQVRFLRKLMPGEGVYMHVLCYLLKTLERYAVPAAIASCCTGSIRALLASRLSLTWYCALLSFVRILQVSCICHTVIRSAGALERSKNQEWPLNGVSELRSSAAAFDVCECDVWRMIDFGCNVRVGSTTSWHVCAL